MNALATFFPTGETMGDKLPPSEFLRYTWDRPQLKIGDKYVYVVDLLATIDALHDSGHFDQRKPWGEEFARLLRKE
jgi:hypothetical protein